MTVYMTKVWGFSVPCGPLQFSTKGWRDGAREVLKPGDLVVLVGTKGDQTDLEFKGRALGIMAPTTEVVSTLDFDLDKRAVDFDSEGNYRWPFGLINRQAWEFLEPPLFEEISSRQFGMDSASGIVPLLEEEARQIENFPKREVELLAPIRTIARIEGEESARRKAAPPPTTKRTGVMHFRRAPAYTYLMKIESASKSAFKVGWAFDYKMRERSFNLSSLPQLGGLRYRTSLYHLWSTARAAYKMEQTILKQFDTRRHQSNREVLYGVEHEVLQSAWIAYLQSNRR
ncbi:MAG: hypothetical protein HYX37_11240 [Rhizobiales bacterium]|nr:hypothetical protein [Hyphomicrobiales bacterium]